MQARERNDVVVVSLFVNPAQFNDAADLERYPRDERADRDLLGAAGVDVLFAPTSTRSTRTGFATQRAGR